MNDGGSGASMGDRPAPGEFRCAMKTPTKTACPLPSFGSAKASRRSKNSGVASEARKGTR